MFKHVVAQITEYIHDISADCVTSWGQIDLVSQHRDEDRHSDNLEI